MFTELKTVVALAPELALILAASGIFVAATCRRSRVIWLAAAFVAYAVAAVLLAAGHSPSASGPLATGPIVVDDLAQAFRWVGLITGLAITAAVAKSADDRLIGETLGSIMLAAAGVMIVASAQEMVTLFLGLEMISIPTYALLYLGRRDAASSEATMKYFFLSILSSAVLLYGLSFLYGIGGTTWLVGSGSFGGIREALAGTGKHVVDASLLSFAPAAIVLILAGLAFKLAAVPFHFYAPDVYQGTTNANAGLLAVAPKIAGVAAAMRLLIGAIPLVPAAEGNVWSGIWQLALVLSVVTMTLGNICALWQNHLRRMLAYSSIAHAGYLLVGLAAAAAPGNGLDVSGGVAAMVFYSVVYALASLGVFIGLAALSSQERQLNSLEDLAGLAKSQPALAAAIAACLFSLAGIPPLAGFWGKLQLFVAALSQATGSELPAARLWFMVLAIAGALNAAIAAAYYLRVIGAMYFRPSTREHALAGGWGPHLAACGCALAVFLSGAFPGQLLQLSQRAEQQLAGSSAPTTTVNSVAEND